MARDSKGGSWAGISRLAETVIHDETLGHVSHDSMKKRIGLQPIPLVASLLGPTSLSLALGFLSACQAAAPAPTPSTAAKIDPPLAAAVQALDQGGSAGARTDARGRLLIYVYVTDTGSATLDSVAQAGLAEMRTSPEIPLVQGWVYPQDLAALAALPCVKKISLPLYGTPR